MQVLLDSPTICRKPYQQQILIAVYSSFGHQAFRQTIRETWGNKKALVRNEADLIFFLGRSKHKEGEENDLRKEANTFGDIIQTGKTNNLSTNII